MSFVNPYKKRLDLNRNKSIDDQKIQVTNEEKNEEIQEMTTEPTQEIIDDNSNVDLQTNEINEKIDITRIPITFDSSNITGIPQSLLVSSTQLGMLIVKYEKEIPNEEIKLTA